MLVLVLFCACACARIVLCTLPIAIASNSRLGSQLVLVEMLVFSLFRTVSQALRGLLRYWVGDSRGRRMRELGAHVHGRRWPLRVLAAAGLFSSP